MIERSVVGVILYNAQGEVLLQLRDDKPTIPFPNQWTLFGGAVEDGESPDEAVKRELIEELELELPLTFWKSYTCPVRTIAGERITTNHVYIGKLECELDDLTLHEGQKMAYFDATEAAKLELAFQQAFLIKEFFAEILRT